MTGSNRAPAHFNTTYQEILPSYTLTDGTMIAIASTLGRTETCLRIVAPEGLRYNIKLGSMPLPDYGLHVIQGLCTELLLGDAPVPISLDVWLLLGDIGLNKNLLRSILSYINPNSYSLATDRTIELLKNHDGRLDYTMCLKLIKQANNVHIGEIEELLYMLVKQRDIHPGILDALLRKVHYPSREAIQSFIQFVRKEIIPEEPFTIAYAGQSSYDT